MALRQLGVEVVFGIVGIPVIEVADSCQKAGIRFIGFRNEQAATYAASIYGYLTGNPGVALVVGGPGVVHALAGVENARANRFPLLLLAGSSETHLRGKGAFQQLNQISLLRASGAKFAEQPPDLHELPRLVEQGYRTSYFGIPGATYIDLPADIIQSTQVPETIPVLHPPGKAPRSAGDPDKVNTLAAVLRKAKWPLLIIGKGCASAQAESAVRRLQEETGLAFLPTPMGKGVVPDSAPANVSAARSQALRKADIIVVLAARLNWILHYGEQPRFSPDVKIWQVDTAAEEIGVNGGCDGILGDVGLVCDQIADAVSGWHAPPLPPDLQAKRRANEERAQSKELVVKRQLTYEPVFAILRQIFESEDVILVSEGANTMDISRASFPMENPRRRLDAGTNATMGLGIGYAIAAKVALPHSKVVAIEGDSAFGFSALEIETAVRNKLHIIVVVMNNSGVYHGSDPELYKPSTDKPLPSTALGLETRYDLLAESLGARGFLCRNLNDVASSAKEALSAHQVCVLNVILDPAKDKKLEFGWMSSAKPKI